MLRAEDELVGQPKLILHRVRKSKNSASTPLQPEDMAPYATIHVDGHASQASKPSTIPASNVRVSDRTPAPISAGPAQHAVKS